MSFILFFFQIFAQKKTKSQEQKNRRRKKIYRFADFIEKKKHIKARQGKEELEKKPHTDFCHKIS